MPTLSCRKNSALASMAKVLKVLEQSCAKALRSLTLIGTKPQEHGYERANHPSRPDDCSYRRAGMHETMLQHAAQYMSHVSMSIRPELETMASQSRSSRASRAEPQCRDTQHHRTCGQLWDRQSTPTSFKERDGHPHPVDGGLDVLQPSRGRPRKVGQRLPQRQPGHGSRVDEALDRLLSNGSCCACQAKVALGHDSHVGHWQLQRPTALLLGDQACRHKKV